MANKQTAEHPLLLQRRLPKKGWAGFLLYQAGLGLLACAGLTFFTLLLSAANFDRRILLGFFHRPLILGVNLAVACAVYFLFFALFGRQWIAFLATWLLCLGIALGNYYLILIRSDPLRYPDLFCLREALAITSEARYCLTVSWQAGVSVLGCVGLTACLALLSRWQLRLHWYRLFPLAMAVFLFFGTVDLCRDPALFRQTKNYEYIDTWSSTQIYVSRGILYSFASTVGPAEQPPEGYSEAEAKKLLSAYSDRDIPPQRRIDLIVIMRESYADLSRLSSNAGTVDWSCYGLYHALEAESLTGTLVTNAFGGDTKNTERCFLTGNYTVTDWRKPANSYVWYLRQQGYYTDGLHPFAGWFYNRVNVNRYLGFCRYLFREDVFSALAERKIVASDATVYDQLLRQYRDCDRNTPYFNFTVTFEGHGPYSARGNSTASRYVLQDADTPEGYALNNYLAVIHRRDRALLKLVQTLRDSDRPVALLTFGDHKATLSGDPDRSLISAYEHYGMDLEPSTSQGFSNRYSTEYLLWLNDAAKQELGLNLAGQIGPTVSPCYLMNVVFDALGWGGGPAYLQAMGELMQTIPVYSTRGRIGLGEELQTTIPPEALEAYRRMQYLSYYWRTEFRYRSLAES